MHSQERKKLIIFGSILFGVAFLVTFLWFGPGESPGRRADPPSSITLAPGAEAVVHYLLADGHVATTEVVTVPDGLVGLTLQELQSARPDWRVVSFAPERVVVSAPCGPVRGASGFIGVSAGKVTIFRGHPQGCHEVYEVTDMDAEILGANVHQSEGSVIPFDDLSEIPFILEGLTGHTL